MELFAHHSLTHDRSVILLSTTTALASFVIGLLAWARYRNER